MAEEIKVNDDNFSEEVLEADKPVLVDFWASWCQPCKMVAPIVEKIANNFEGEVKVAKYNMEENGDQADEYGISGIPTLIIFDQGEVAQKFVGVKPYNVLAEALEEFTQK